MLPHDYYCQQSPISDPGDYAGICDGLPDDITGICRAAQGLIAHYAAPAHRPPSERMREIARVTLDESRFQEWQRLYRDDRLRIPPVIESFSPAAKPEDMPINAQLSF